MSRVLLRAVALTVAIFGACLAGGCGAVEVTESQAEVVPKMQVFDAPTRPASGVAIPYSPRPQLNLDAVWWQAPRAEPVGRLADRWGVREKTLVALNPALAQVKRVQAGQRLLIYRHEPGTVSRSVGAPNRGRIENSAAFPQGEGWVLRSFRPRSYATRHTVKELALSLTQWREDFPQSNPVKIGEFSKRGGGRVRPHKSHRTGRDVDIGYVMLDSDVGHRFVTVNDDNLDAAATWGLVQRLLASGAVDSIFMAKSVQLQLIPYAAQTMDESQQRATFSVLEPDARARKKTSLRAWRGHDDHMHVRFGCTEADLGCRDAAPRKKKRRKKKRRRGRNASR